MLVVVDLSWVEELPRPSNVAVSALVVLDPIARVFVNYLFNESLATMYLIMIIVYSVLFYNSTVNRDADNV